MKIAIVVGTRPEAIKLAPVYDSVRKRFKEEPLMIFTGQHTDLMESVAHSIKLPCHIQLHCQSENQNINDLYATLMKELNRVFVEERPSCVVVQGDTTSALAGAMAAFHLKIPVAHVEAGLRTFDLKNPFPEEANRQLISKVASLHFAPTKSAFNHLKNEDYKGIHLSGNTIVDSVFRQNLISNKKVELKVKGEYILVTTHRRESFDRGIGNICEALKTLATENKDLSFVLPIHPNPIVKRIVEDHLSVCENVHLIEPLGYTEMLAYIKGSLFVMSDSGGLQEEVCTIGKPILVLREKTERPEAIDCGAAILTGLEVDSILESANALISKEGLRIQMSEVKNPFGDGLASIRIAEVIYHLLLSSSKEETLKAPVDAEE